MGEIDLLIKEIEDDTVNLELKKKRLQILIQNKRDACPHEWKCERESGPYGELYDHCHLCGAEKKH